MKPWAEPLKEGASLQQDFPVHKGFIWSDILKMWHLRKNVPL